MDEETNFAVRKLLTMVETTNMYYATIKVLNLKNESIVSFKKHNNMRRPMSIKDLKSAVLSIQKLILFNFNMGKDFPLKGISFKLESFGYKELIVS